MDAAAVTVFVYFKVDRHIDDDAVRTSIGRLAASMAAEAGGNPMTVMRRAAPVSLRTAGSASASVGTDSGATTWMEIHPDVDRESLAAWLERLERAAARSGLAALIAGGRHVEVFESVDRHPPLA
jgi:hypothetical protein